MSKSRTSDNDSGKDSTIIHPQKGVLPSQDLIGHYAIETPESKAAAMNSDSPINMLSVSGTNAEALDQAVTNILGEQGKKVLLKDTKSSTTARKAFMDELQKVLNRTNNDMLFDGGDPTEDAIKLVNLLGKKGVELYKAAIEEERNSPEFRNAVFLRATKRYVGRKWKERLVLWVAGPSASGKSYGTDAIIKEISEQRLLETTPNQEGNFVIAIDGGIEREVSQMRKLVLQVALKKGHPGIIDLHEETSLNIKSVIRKAADRKGLNIAIPNTFTNPLTAFKIGKIDKQNNKQIFSEVVGPEGQFRETVQRMGNMRAFAEEYGTLNASSAPIEMNTYDVGVESKKYSKKYFGNGLKGSAHARKYYQHTSKDNIYMTLHNDLIFIIKDHKSGQWRKATEKDKGTVVRITASLFPEFQKAYAADPQLDAKQWVKANDKPSAIEISRTVSNKSETYKKLFALVEVARSFEDSLERLYARATPNREERSAGLKKQLHESILMFTHLKKRIADLENIPNLSEAEGKLLQELQHLQSSFDTSIRAISWKLNRTPIELAISKAAHHAEHIQALIYDLIHQSNGLKDDELKNKLMELDHPVINNLIEHQTIDREDHQQVIAIIHGITDALENAEANPHTDKKLIANLHHVIKIIGSTVNALAAIQEQDAPHIINENNNIDEMPNGILKDDDAPVVVGAKLSPPTGKSPAIPLQPDPLHFDTFISLVKEKQALGYPCLDEIQACFKKDNRGFIFKNESRTEAFRDIFQASYVLMAKSIIEKDKAAFLGINVDEFYGNKDFTSRERTPTIVDFAPNFNRLANWIKLNILATNDTKEIAFAITYWTNTAFECAFNPNLKDANGALAIHSALNNFAVKSMIDLLQESGALTQDVINKIDQLDTLFSPTKNNKNVKDMLANNVTAIPYIGTMLQTREFTSRPDLLSQEVEGLRKRQATISTALPNALSTHKMEVTREDIDTANTNLVDQALGARLNDIAPKAGDAQARSVPTHKMLPQQLNRLTTPGSLIEPSANSVMPATLPRSYPNFSFTLAADQPYRPAVYDELMAANFKVIDNEPDAIDLMQAAHDLVMLNIPNTNRSLLNVDPYVRVMALANYVVVNSTNAPNEAEKAKQWLAIFMRELTPEQRTAYHDFIKLNDEFDRKLNADYNPINYQNDLLTQVMGSKFNDQEKSKLTAAINNTTELEKLEVIENYINKAVNISDKLATQYELLSKYLPTDDAQAYFAARVNFDLTEQMNMIEKYEERVDLILEAQDDLSGYSPDFLNQLSLKIINAADNKSLMELKNFVRMPANEHQKFQEDIHRLLESALPHSAKEQIKNAYENIDILALNKLRAQYTSTHDSNQVKEISAEHLLRNVTYFRNMADTILSTSPTNAELLFLARRHADLIRITDEFSQKNPDNLDVQKNATALLDINIPEPKPQVAEKPPHIAPPKQEEPMPPKSAKREREAGPSLKERFAKRRAAPVVAAAPPPKDETYLNGLKDINRTLETINQLLNQALTQINSKDEVHSMNSFGVFAHPQADEPARPQQPIPVGPGKSK